MVCFFGVGLLRFGELWEATDAASYNLERATE